MVHFFTAKCIKVNHNEQEVRLSPCEMESISLSRSYPRHGVLGNQHILPHIQRRHLIIITDLQTFRDARCQLVDWVPPTPPIVVFR